MREYKFRAWDKNDHEMNYQPLFSFLFGYENDLYGNVELMQYTGLKDKNGKEIYEGDIVKENNSIGEIIYDCCEFRINWIVNKDFYNDSLGYHYKYLEVIGNIYDNPELLPEYQTVSF